MVVVDFSMSSSREISAAYLDLAALLCKPKMQDCVLLQTGGEEADMHYALHDVVNTVARVVGGPLQVRIAIVGSSRTLAQVCGTIRPALALLGCELRLFGSETQAVSWLLASAPALSARRDADAAIPM